MQLLHVSICTVDLQILIYVEWSNQSFKLEIHDLAIILIILL